MKFRITLLAMLILFLPLTALAASHEHGAMTGMDHSAHDGMKMDGSMIMLPMQTVNGISATVHIKDVTAAMSKMGLEATHHFMVTFEDDKNGEELVPQMVAVKITGPDGKTAEPVRLMAMSGHSGADVVLKQKGEYTFEVGTKLPDGQKRTFEFKQTLK